MKKTANNDSLFYVSSFIIIAVMAVGAYMFFNKKTEDKNINYKPPAPPKPKEIDYVMLSHDDKIKLIINHIKHDTTHYLLVKKRSSNNKKSVDEELKYTAEWLLQRYSAKWILTNKYPYGDYYKN